MISKHRFQKKDCGKPMTREESRRVQLDMLDALADFCDRNGLSYYLSGGTLLGAIRHHGFIPWDDDIDVNIPRPDCEKLYALTGGRLGKYIFARPDRARFCDCCECFRVYDPGTVIESYHGGAARKHPTYSPIFIDVFPIEGLPTSSLLTKLHYGRIIFLRKMARVSSLEHNEGSSWYAYVFHAVCAVPAKLVGYRKWSGWIQKTATRYSFDTHSYVGVMTAPFQSLGEKVKKKDFCKAIPVEFEGKVYHGPAGFHTYLTQLYGDYMKLPPEEKRKSHHEFRMYWRERAEKKKKI